MRSIRRSGVKALTAAIALSVGAVPLAFTAGMLPGDDGTSLTAADAPTPEAWLTLQTGSVDQVALNTGRDTTVEKSQALSTGRNCLLATDGSLLGFTGSSLATGASNAASFSSDSIGVAEKKSGTSCYQVGSPDEALTLTLNKDNLRGTLGPLSAASALLDVELKQGAQILATLGKQGSDVVAYRELRSGASINSPKPLPSGVNIADSDVSICNNPADSGPDAGVLDNCLWAISKPSWQTDDGLNFDILKLQALNGSFSVEGGVDGTVTNYSAPLSTGASDKPPAGTPLPAGLSFFELSTIPDGLLGCTDTTGIPGDETETLVRELDPVNGKPEVKIRRLANASTTEPCEAVPYTLANGAGSATFYKPLDLQVSAQFIVTLRWWFPVGAYSTAGAGTAIYNVPTPANLPATTINFEIPGGPEALAMGWCRNPLIDEVSGGLTGVTNPTNVNDVPDMEPNLEKVQHACLGTRQANPVLDADVASLYPALNGKPQFELREQVYLQGDAKFSGS